MRNQDSGNDDAKSGDTLDIGQLNVVLILDGSRGNRGTDESGLEPFDGRDPAHYTTFRVVVNIIVLVNCVSKDPEVIDTWQEVDETESIILSLADVSKQITSTNLDPISTGHDPDIRKLRATVGEEYTVFFVGVRAIQQTLEEDI